MPDQTATNKQSEKEQNFHRLHHNGKILLLPNIWDPLGALLLQDMGYPAVATSSSAIALSRGYHDGEKLPFDELLRILKRITNSVSIPVTADVESGYASDNFILKEHVKKLLDTGIAGINFEDSIHDQNRMVDINEQCKKIELIRKTANECGSSLFINARVDTYIKAEHLNNTEKLSETLKRGKAYKDAGADGLYPILLKDKNHIEAITKEVGLPVNITLLPGIPTLDVLQNIGVARLSLASGFLKLAATTMKDIATKLLKHKDISAEMEGMVSSDYLNKLIPSK